MSGDHMAEQESFSMELLEMDVENLVHCPPKHGRPPLLAALRKHHTHAKKKVSCVDRNTNMFAQNRPKVHVLSAACFLLGLCHVRSL